jgi:hypothetical protein
MNFFFNLQKPDDFFWRMSHQRHELFYTKTNR